MGTARKRMAEDAKARANVYGFLANIFRAEPSQDLIEELRTPEFSETLSSLGLNLGVKFSQTPLQDLQEELAIEYTKLFVGPGSHISPHESIFTEVDGGRGGLWGEQTVAVKKFIESAGFEYKAEFPGLPDHIGAELEFMQKLAETEAGLRSGGETEIADWCLRVQKKFLEDHLIKWVPQFSDEVRQNANLPFYAQMAEVLKSYLEFDKQTLPHQLSEPA